MVLDFGLMPMFMVEHFIVALNLDGPHRNAPKEVSYFDFFLPYFLGILSQNMACFQLKQS